MRNAELERKWTARMVSVAGALEMLDEGGGCKSLQGGRVYSIGLKLPTEARPDVLIVVKACVGDEKYVGFVGGIDVVTAFLMWQKKERGAGLSYREDRPYVRSGSGEGIL